MMDLMNSFGEPSNILRVRFSKCDFSDRLLYSTKNDKK